MSAIVNAPPASLLAGMMLFLREVVPWKGWPTVAEILPLAGAGRSQACEMRDRIRSGWHGFLGRPGRPATEPTEGFALFAACQAVLRFVLTHPGSACGPEARTTYSDEFRRFVVALSGPGQPGEGLSVAALASACLIPLGTMKNWMHPHLSSCDRSASISEESVAAPAPGPVADETTVTLSASEASVSSSEPLFPDCIQAVHLKQIAALWKPWQGTFQAFCKMLRTEHRLHYSPTFISDFLQAARLRSRRVRTPVEAPWSSGTFRILFPGPVLPLNTVLQTRPQLYNALKAMFASVTSANPTPCPSVTPSNCPQPDTSGPPPW